MKGLIHTILTKDKGKTPKYGLDRSIISTRIGRLIDRQISKSTPFPLYRRDAGDTFTSFVVTADPKDGRFANGR